MPNPWDIPPATKVGNVNPDEIYVEVGKALSKWEMLEDALAWMFSELVGAPSNAYPHDFDPTPAERAYGSIVGFRSRLNMIEAAAAGYFHVRSNTSKPDEKAKITTLERQTKHLLKQVSGWSDRRNDVAHGVVVLSTDSRMANDYVLIPPGYNSKKYGPQITSDPAYTYNAAQITEFRNQFLRLAREIAELRFQPGRPPAPEEVRKLEEWLQSPLFPSEDNPPEGEKKC